MLASQRLVELSSGFVEAETSVRSPRKIFVFIIYTKLVRIKVSGKHFIIEENLSSVLVESRRKYEFLILQISVFLDQIVQYTYYICGILR